jgi:MFS family permease
MIFPGFDMGRSVRCAAVERPGGIGRLAAVGGVGAGVAVGWNIATLGPIATELSHAYGVGLATIGLFLTVQFVMHMVMQIPGGRVADRWGARRSAFLGLALVGAGNAISLIAPHVALGFAGRAVVGVGTGFAFVAASDYIRSCGGSPFVQGIFGGGSVLAPGAAVAIIPPLFDWLGWRAPYLSAIVVVAVCTVLLALAPAAPRAVRHAGERLDTGFFRDTRLYRLAVVHAMSFGFSVIVGNWVVTLLEHHGYSKSDASIAGSLTLLLGFFTRAAGGWLLKRPDASRWVAGSLVLCGIGTITLALPLPLPVLVAAAAVVGLAAGTPFAMAFTGAARARPDSPGAAVGFVNMWASLAIVAGTPLVGLTFSLPGDGRIGFVVLGVLAALAALATPRWRP